MGRRGGALAVVVLVVLAMLAQGCGNGQVANSNGGGIELWFNAEPEAQEVPRQPGRGCCTGYGPFVTLDRKFLPEGTYLLSAKTYLVNFDNDTSFICDLEDNQGNVIDGQIQLGIEGLSTTGTSAHTIPLVLGGVFTQPAPGGNVELRCKASTDGGAEARGTQLAAIQVATVH
jgi:hypothetical protein